MERLKDLNLSRWTKEDLIDLLDEHPTLFEMSEGELRQLARDKYWVAQGLIDQANRLESDSDAITRYCNEKYRPIPSKN